MRGPSRFVEVGDRVFLARYPQWDVSVGLVVGGERALVVDTRGSEVQGREVVEDLARLSLPVPVTVVVNTHVHYDHTFGNHAFDGAPSTRTSGSRRPSPPTPRGSRPASARTPTPAPTRATRPRTFAT